MRRGAATAAVALALGLWPAAAHADETVVVPGTAFPSTSTYLTWFGCTDLYSAASAGPEVRVNRDDAAPLGRRAASLAMPGTGSASGPVSLVSSVASATSSTWVSTSAGSEGVAYVWYVSDELERGEVWAGRADLVTTVDGWQQVDALAATYDWTRYDAASGEVIEQPGEDSLGDFTEAHGDGPGYLLSGFGCDGRAFGVDRIEAGTTGAVTTYDLEGWSVTTSITATPEQVTAGDPVTVTGSSVAPDGRVMAAPLQLEVRADGAAGFRSVGDPVSPGEDGLVATTVVPEESADYRWVFAETGYTDQHWSAEARVVVVPPPPPSPSRSPEPTPKPSPKPSPSTEPRAEPSQEASETPAFPEVTATPEQDPSTEASPTDEPSGTPSDEASPSGD